MFEKLYEILSPCCCCLAREKVEGDDDGENNNNWDTKNNSKNNIMGVMNFTNDAFEIDRDWPDALGPKLNVHPLQNSLILSKIFSHLSFPDLIHCRLVSRQWRREATNSIILHRKSGAIWINHEEIPLFIKAMKRAEQENLNPYRRYALNMMTVPTSLKSSINRRMDLRSFFETFGPRVTMLIVRILELDLPFLVEYLKLAQNLETFLLIIATDEMTSISPTNSVSDPTDFQNEQINFHDAQKQMQASIKQLQKLNYDLKLPKLTEFRLAINGTSHVDRCITEILNSSSNLRILDMKKWASGVQGAILEESKYLGNLQQFISNPLNNSQLLQLSSHIWGGQSMSVLTYLEIELNPDVEDAVLFQLFKLVSQSLEVVQASHRGKYSAFHFPVQMPKLQAIVLKEWAGPILVDSIVLNCPNLEKLDFEKFNPDNIVAHKSSSDHQRLERLGLLYDEEFPKRKIKGVLKRLLPKFPQLQDFYSGAETDDIFELIIKEINPKLDSIFVDFSMEISDASVTGIPLDVIETCPDEDALCLPCGCWVLKNPEACRKNPYVGDLQELQQAHISFEMGSQITNLSLHHGLIDLKNLRVLRLFSKEIAFCLYAVGDNFPHLEKLHLKSRHLYRDEDVQWLMAKRPELDLEFSVDNNDYMYVIQRIPLEDSHAP